MIDLIHESIIPGFIVLLLSISFILFCFIYQHEFDDSY